MSASKELSMSALQRRYCRARDREGLTVAEFEIREGLPQYSVFPEVRDAKVVHARGEPLGERGCFMYRNATDEEKGIEYPDEEKLAQADEEKLAVDKQRARWRRLRAALKHESVSTRRGPAPGFVKGRAA